MLKETPPPVGYEKRDASVKYTAMVGAALVLAAVAMHWGLGVLFFSLRSHYDAKPDFTEKSALPPEPRLQSNPQLDLQAYLQRQEKLLTSYGWIDPAHGIARIPIDRAIELYVARAQKGQGAGK